jgi:hypothetical protein
MNPYTSAKLEVDKKRNILFNTESLDQHRFSENDDNKIELGGQREAHCLSNSSNKVELRGLGEDGFLLDES